MIRQHRSKTVERIIDVADLLDDSSYPVTERVVVHQTRTVNDDGTYTEWEEVKDTWLD